MLTADERMRSAIAALSAAAAAQQISASCEENAGRWLKTAGCRGSHESILVAIEAGNWQEIDASFWEVIPFGTGGRRGPMGSYGSATINARTIAESANGLAVYFQKVNSSNAGRAVIAHDTRNRSAEFARLTACTFAARGMKVFLFDGHRSTPCLSYAVRHLGCDVGAMISASHNPPADNGFKAYWSNGAQVLPPHDTGIIDCVYSTDEIPTVDFDSAVASGKIELIGESIDASYIASVLAQRFAAGSPIPILFTPLHGVGETSVYRALREAGYTGLKIFEPQREPNGNFPNVPNQFPNPELAAVFSGELIDRAASMSAAVVFASDPDADRLGVAVRDSVGHFRHLSGNRIGVLLTDYILRRRSAAQTLTSNHFVIETLVTTPLTGAIALSHGVRLISDLLVGFKYIGQTIDREGPDLFVFGTEESLGFLAGTYCRDKDAAVAALLLAEAAAEQQLQGKTLLDRLDELFVEHGYYEEAQRSETCKGPKGRALIGTLMKEFAENPPTELAGVKLGRVRDYCAHETRSLPGNKRTDSLPEPQGDLLIFESQPGDCEITFAARPSGTEPKIKFYFFAKMTVPNQESLSHVKAEANTKLAAFQAALSAWVHAVWAAG